MFTLPAILAYIFIIPSIQLHLKSPYHAIELTHINYCHTEGVLNLTWIWQFGCAPVFCTHQTVGLMMTKLFRVKWDETIIVFSELESTREDAFVAYFKTLSSIQNGKIKENQNNILNENQTGIFKIKGRCSCWSCLISKAWLVDRQACEEITAHAEPWYVAPKLLIDLFVN